MIAQNKDVESREREECRIQYREYKILLRPERFFNPSQFEVN